MPDRNADHWEGGQRVSRADCGGQVTKLSKETPRWALVDIRAEGGHRSFDHPKAGVMVSLSMCISQLNLQE